MFPSFANDKASQLFSMEQEEAHESTHLAEELLAVDGQWGKKRQFSSLYSPSQVAYAPMHM